MVAHLYLAGRGTHQVMLRLPRTLLDLKTVEPYCAEPQVTAWITREHLILDLIGQGERRPGGRRRGLFVGDRRSPRGARPVRR